MAVKHVLTRGYGNGTFNGKMPLVLLRGYGYFPDPKSFIVALPERARTMEIGAGRSTQFSMTDRTVDMDMGDRSTQTSLPDRTLDMGLREGGRQST